MNTGLKILKYQAAGNDFVVVTDPLTTARVAGTASLRYALCHRRFGIGADGVILLDRHGRTGAACNLHYYNADGARGSMCGNGARAALACARDLDWLEHDSLDLWVDGLRCHHGWFRGLDPTTTEARFEVELFSTGRPEPVGPGHWFLDTGSPHQVIQLEPGLLRNHAVAVHGKELRHAPEYAPIGGTNVNYFEELEPGYIAARTFERGVEAETWACGTGAAACALAYAHSVGRPLGTTPVRVRMPGGELTVRQGPDPHTVLLGGPAGAVFEAVLPHSFVVQAERLATLPHELQ